MTSIPNLVYIDTHVFAYQLLSYSYSMTAKIQKMIITTGKFFQDIQNGKYQAIISTFTETEYRSVVKKVISCYMKRPITPQEENIAMNDFRAFNQSMGIGLTNSDVIAYNNNINQIDIFSTTDYTIQNNVNPYLDDKWKVIGGADAILLNMALRSGANMIATFDMGFKGVKHPSIQALIIPDIYNI